ncbi:MAG TPA: 3,4-dehydroadipyl-CoA semialdehyde dehydrogenase, partial [Myxococcota bacterium]|nr:3,4-dehydroadipyl-CoA semialdehyde dehydrogenase [Myxococcota bacterium]
LLKAMSRAIHAHRDELLDLSTRSYGATRGDGKFDVDGASGTLAWYASLGASLGDRRWLPDGEPEGIGRSTRFAGQHLLVPRRGVAVHINAFNFPAWGMCEKLAVSLLAGVPALVKPATATALVTWRIVQLWEGLLPEGAVSLLVGPPGDLLDHLESQDVIAFTGSSDTARHLRAHPRVLDLGVPINVEADSLNAAVLAPDVAADSPTFDLFLADVVRDLVQKAGQKCTAIRRVFVPADRLDDVRDGLGDLLGRVELGALSDGDTVIGPLATAAQRRDVTAGLDALVAATEPFVGPVGALPDAGWFVQPQVRLAAHDAPIVHEREVFGPVATVLPYDGSAAQAAAQVNRGGGGLVVSLYSDDPAWAGEAILELGPWHGRIYWGSKRVAGEGTGPGTVLPQLVHGGPGKAGGGQELGGQRGLAFYLQRVAIQGDRALLDRALGGGS